MKMFMCNTILYKNVVVGEVPASSPSQLRVKCWRPLLHCLEANFYIFEKNLKKLQIGQLSVLPGCSVCWVPAGRWASADTLSVLTTADKNWNPGREIIEIAYKPLGAANHSWALCKTPQKELGNSTTVDYVFPSIINSNWYCILHQC